MSDETKVETTEAPAGMAALGALSEDNAPEAAAAALPEAVKRVDKAAKRNIIHANAAARKKSQLARAAAK